MRLLEAIKYFFVSSFCSVVELLDNNALHVIYLYFAIRYTFVMSLVNLGKVESSFKVATAVAVFAGAILVGIRQFFKTLEYMDNMTRRLQDGRKKEEEELKNKPKKDFEPSN